MDDWAHLMVRPVGSRLEFVIRTDFGVWEYIWVNIGERDWREFLINLDNDYLTGKLEPGLNLRRPSKKITQFACFLRLVWPRVKDMLMKDLQAEGRSTIVTS